MNRRQFLATASMTASGLLVPGRPALATAPSISGNDLNFIFVFNHGGWDVTRVLAATFDNSAVSMEYSAEPLSVGNLELVSQRERPSVDTFFEAWYDRCAIFSGLQVSSIAHDDCILRVMTGTSAEAASDWPSIIAASSANALTLPNLVLGGPSFPGSLGQVVARAGQSGQLASLLTGEILERSDVPVTRPSSPSVGIIDRYMTRRVAARADSARSVVDQRLANSINDSLQRALELKDYQYILDLTGGENLGLQVPLAVEALALGLCRCVTLGHPGDFETAGWDSHGDNDDAQSGLWETLFAELGQLMTQLSVTPGRFGGTLADETVVVVLSEMGRAPYINSTNGKDHWPYTSAMMVGPNITGDRMVGAWSDAFGGEAIDLATGELDPGGVYPTVENFGATLLALAGIDPGEHVPGYSPIEGVLL